VNLKEKSCAKSIVSLVIGDEIQHAHIHLIPSEEKVLSGIHELGKKVSTNLDLDKARELVDKFKLSY
jgi:diadenosine tetraphosphate (Ap4A) HIT family hydrolase